MGLLAVIVGLGAMRGTMLFVELLPWPPAPWVRSLVAAVLTVPLALLTGARGQELVLLSAGAWGATAVLHEVVSILSMLSDYFKLQVLLGAANRRR